MSMKGYTVSRVAVIAARSSVSNWPTIVMSALPFSKIFGKWEILVERSWHDTLGK